jgi:hypothetical protein
MKMVLFGGLRPFNPKAALRDLVAGATLASMNIPQVLGYARTDCWHARRYRALHGAAPNSCVRGLRFLAPSCCGRRFRNRRLYFSGLCLAWQLTLIISQ